MNHSFPQFVNRQENNRTTYTSSVVLWITFSVDFWQVAQYVGSAVGAPKFGSILLSCTSKYSVEWLLVYRVNRNYNVKHAPCLSDCSCANHVCSALLTSLKQMEWCYWHAQNKKRQDTHSRILGAKLAIKLKRKCKHRVAHEISEWR